MACILLLSGCAGWEPALDQPVGQNRPPPSTLQSYESLHFTVRAHGFDHCREVADISEQVYSKVMFDTNLLSFKPKENYPIVVFQDRQEYQRETGYPAWSGGGAVTQLLGQTLPGERDIHALTAIYTFEEVLSPPLLAHEISHLIFNEYMEFFTAQDADRVRWLNEGFATFEETEAYGPSQRDERVRLTRPMVRQNGFPLEKVVSFNPFNQPVINLGTYVYHGRSYILTNVDVWYWQVRELVSFLMNSQGRYNFYLFLSALKQKKPLDEALAYAYPGKWRNLRDLENEWRQSLQ